jgi:hypothetical protein
VVCPPILFSVIPELQRAGQRRRRRRRNAQIRRMTGQIRHELVHKRIKRIIRLWKHICHIFKFL